ncbi:MAG: ribonuclease, partial [Propionibacterium sp.]|nr:ribonuclease [Propionibacterium sp.]
MCENGRRSWHRRCRLGQRPSCTATRLARDCSSAPETVCLSHGESCALSRALRVRSLSMTDSSVEPETTQSGPRRRRTASRPAGPPVEVEVEETAAKTESAFVEDVRETAPQPEPEARPTRRRATRRTAPAAADEEVVVVGEKSAPKQPEPVAAPAPDPQPEAKAEPTSEPDEAAETARPARRTRRRSAPKSEQPTTDEPAVDEAATDADGIEAAIAQAEKAADARKAAVANPFMSEAEREKQLALLAGAIAAGPEADEDSDDEDEESDEDDDSDEADDESDDSDDDDDDDDDDESGDDSEDTERPVRRRRRRGGRRRRRPAGGGEGGSDSTDTADAQAAGTDASEDTDDAETDTNDNGATNGNGDGDGSSTTTRRRRRRRRRPTGSDDSDSSSDEVTGIEGSTRMEAKRQRRKESRAAGRRRAPIVSEAEFLARRESVDRKMVIRQSEDFTQLGVLEDSILVEHYVDRASAASLIGNVFLGKVQNVLPSMEAAFIDIGRGRNAVLYAGEVDWQSFGVTGEDRKVEKVLKSGQSIVVQVTKDPVGQKGARLTHHISLPGRYIVYSPGGHLSGISRKLPDTERSRLRNILSNHIGSDESVIVRTAAEGANEEDLVRDVNRLKAQWEVIEKAAKKGG